MLPTWSIAIEPIQREFESGAKVDAWYRVGESPGSRTSYPANGGGSAVRADRVVGDERLVVAEVAIDQPVHEAPVESFKQLGRPS